MNSRLLPYLIVMAVVGCAAPPPEPQRWEERLSARGYVMAESVERIRDYRINGWNELDRRHVVIHTGVRDRYLITLRNPCEGLVTADLLAFSTTVGSVTRFDRLVVRGPGQWLETCWIDTIHRLERPPEMQQRSE